MIASAEASMPFGTLVEFVGKLSGDAGSLAHIGIDNHALE
jgi:hypothetical protein